MLKKISAFDTDVIKKGKGIVVVERDSKGRVNSFHALVFSCRALLLEVALIKGSVIETREIRPRDIESGIITIMLTVPYTPIAKTEVGGEGDGK